MQMGVSNGNDVILLPCNKCDGVSGSSSLISLDTNVIGRSFRIASTSTMRVWSSSSACYGCSTKCLF